MPSPAKNLPEVHPPPIPTEFRANLTHQIHDGGTAHVGICVLLRLSLAPTMHSGRCPLGILSSIGMVSTCSKAAHVSTLLPKVFLTVSYETKKTVRKGSAFYVSRLYQVARLSFPGCGSTEPCTLGTTLLLSCVLFDGDAKDCRFLYADSAEKLSC